MPLPLRPPLRTPERSADGPPRPLGALQTADDASDGLRLPGRGSLRLVALRGERLSDLSEAPALAVELSDPGQRGLLGFVGNQLAGLGLETERRPPARVAAVVALEA